MNSLIDGRLIKMERVGGGKEERGKRGRENIVAKLDRWVLKRKTERQAERDGNTKSKRVKEGKKERERDIYIYIYIYIYI